jgi:hypothetical protein
LNAGLRGANGELFCMASIGEQGAAAITADLSSY